MMVGSHKGSNPVFDKGYDGMVWDSDSSEVKEKKRKRQALEAKEAARKFNK